MSHVTTTPHAVEAAAGDLASVGSSINTANANAAAGTAEVDAPGGDAVSAYVSALFAAHAESYQAAGIQANYFHDMFVQVLRASAGTYGNAETANASHLGSGAGTAQHGGMAAPVPSGGVSMSSGNLAGGGLGPSGADAHPAAPGGPQGVTAGGGASGDGGAAVGATNGGGVAGPGLAAAAAVPAAWAPVAPAAPTGPVMPHFATPPAAPPVVAGGYPAAAGLGVPAAVGLGGDPAAIGGFAEPVVPAASAVAASPAAPPPIPTAPKGQPLHQGNPAQSGDASHPADIPHDKAAVPLPLLRLRIPRGLRRGMRSGLRDKEEWREELREAAKSKPWGREELLGALGLRPPGNA
ncbi:PE family protein [Mycobacterium sp. E2699]|uniref:PE family protein n=1 Tax=Mycobacterium sp. E2699 TaxID=1834137 RepID=UPI0008366C79|nr:PE family protein [Mycobacterium sp. E2699]